MFNGLHDTIKYLNDQYRQCVQKVENEDVCGGGSSSSSSSNVLLQFFKSEMITGPRR